MFGFLKKKETEGLGIELPPLEEDGEKEIICAPIEGEVVGCAEISDLTFQKEMLGQSVAIKPAVGKVYAPDEYDINEWTVIGEPDTTVTVRRPATVELTCASVVNRLPDLVAAKPGYVPTSSMIDLTYKLNI